MGHQRPKCNIKKKDEEDDIPDIEVEAEEEDVIDDVDEPTDEGDVDGQEEDEDCCHIPYWLAYRRLHWNGNRIWDTWFGSNWSIR